MIQSYIPSYLYCIICGVESVNETCSDNHQDKLEKIRAVIKQQKELENGKKIEWNTQTIKIYNALQDLIGE